MSKTKNRRAAYSPQVKDHMQTSAYALLGTRKANFVVCGDATP